MTFWPCIKVLENENIDPKIYREKATKQLLFCLFIALRLDVVLGLQAALLTPKRIQSGNAASHNAPDAVVCLLTNAHVIHVFCTPERAILLYYQ